MIAAPGAIDRLAATEVQALRPDREATAAGSPDAFAAMIGQAAATTVGKLEQAEQASMQALQGEADTRTVVDAVMSAEQALQASIAVRDKIVTAYLEISRMSI